MTKDAPQSPATGRASSLVEALRNGASAQSSTVAVAPPAVVAKTGAAKTNDASILFRSGLAVVSDPSLPWSIGRDEDSRFRAFAAASMIFFFLFALVLVLYKPPQIDRAEKEKIPPRLARLLQEKKELPKPEPIKVEEKPKDKPEEVKPEVEERKVDTPKPEAKRAEVKDKPTDLQVKEARERASKSGLFANRDQLAALRELNSDSLRQEQTKVGAEGTERRVERDLIGKVATSGSGGVATKSIAHAGGGTLEGRKTSQVSGPSGAPSLAEVERESKGTKRTHEEIKLAFDANKSAIYGIYRRALRENPLLEGRVVLKLTIDPSGDVSSCTVVSSALKDSELESKLLARVQLINFGTRPKLEVWTGTYHIDFVPSS